MIRIHASDYVPKYPSGTWHWNKKRDRLEFVQRSNARQAREEFVNTNGFSFQNTINQVDELIFRQEFMRSPTSHDADVILLQDIKNLVLYLAPSSIITEPFIQFIHTYAVDRVLRALIIYFEYFLRYVEFILIRRDEISGDLAQLQSEETTEMKRIFSDKLSQYRLILAREYSVIILGDDATKPFYHLNMVVKISHTINDQRFHESFLAFATQLVWIAMHRRAYEVINTEMNRLFRSEHFKLTRFDDIEFTKVESALLYGRNYKRYNYRQQNSPLILELAEVSKENLPLLWIGKRKYRGTDLRVHQLEMEFILPDSQLCLIDVVHGILGHPKKFYNTMLFVDWSAVRRQKFTEKYDPYHIIRQPDIHLPDLNEEKIRSTAEKFDMFYEVKDEREPVGLSAKCNWKQRDEIIRYFKTEGMLTSVWMKCSKEIERNSYGPSTDEIRSKFLEQKEKLRKRRATLKLPTTVFRRN